MLHPWQTCGSIDEPERCGNTNQRAGMLSVAASREFVDSDTTGSSNLEQTAARQDLKPRYSPA
jgi:hypothetical protein